MASCSIKHRINFTFAFTVLITGVQNVWDITLKFRTVAMFVNVDSATTPHTEQERIFISYLPAEWFISYRQQNENYRKGSTGRHASTNTQKGRSESMCTKHINSSTFISITDIKTAW
jgi:hypothetical protein